MKKEKNKISVVIPTYNRANFIDRAIKSVLRQTYQNLELIIVDDASIDNTVKVVKKNSDKRIKYIRHEKNKGAPAARNTGINLASGEYIAFLDSDDKWMLDKLNKQIQKFEKISNDYGVVYGGYAYVLEGDENNSSINHPRFKGDIFSNLLKHCYVGSPTPLVKKECFHKVGGFDEKLPSCQDWDMWLRISRYYKFDYIPDIVANVYLHGNQISSNIKSKIEARELLIKKNYSDFIKNPKIFSSHLRRLGSLYSYYGNTYTGRKYFINSIRKNPLQINSYLHLLLSSISIHLHCKVIEKYGVFNLGDVNIYG